MQLPQLIQGKLSLLKPYTPTLKEHILEHIPQLSHLSLSNTIEEFFLLTLSQIDSF